MIELLKKAMASTFPAMAADDEHSLDLYWHALNYRTAAPQHAEAMWQELQACVERLLEEREDKVRERYEWTDSRPVD